MVESKGLRWFLLAAGFISLLLGVVGIFMPLLPTTPFLLLAAFCFSRSSPRFHNWLLEHKTLGPVILRWRERGAISPRTKLLAMIMILFSVAALWFSAAPLVLAVAVTLFLCGTSVFILTRPGA